MATTDQPAQLQDLSVYAEDLLKAVIPLIGIISFVMFLVGGFAFLTAGGSDENVKKAKGIITGSITGLVLSIVSWLILLLIQNLTGAEVTKFQLGI